MIGGTFEYLISSLPYLSFENTAEQRHKVLELFRKYNGKKTEGLNPVTILDNEAEKFLPKSSFHLFQRMNLNNIHEEEFRNSKNSVLSDFSTFCFDLKKALGQWRRFQNEGEKKSIKNNVEQLLEGSNPLEKEVRLMEYQWKKLEDFSAGHFSDLEAIFIYKIKLLIILRWWSFDAKKGFQKFQKMTIEN